MSFRNQAVCSALYRNDIFYYFHPHEKESFADCLLRIVHQSILLHFPSLSERRRIPDKGGE